jgi:ferredoxin-NADP reductase/Na+-translocating ferredoxin:NAD+ oxidoreductase RnfD subunit
LNNILKKKMLNSIDRFLNKITMYRLVLYYLMLLVVIAAIFGGFGLLPYSPVAILFSAFFISVFGWVINALFAYIFKAQANVESVYITGFILALIITPGSFSDISAMIFLALAITLATASKYVLAIDKKHIFNPVAIAVVITAFVFKLHASWWIGGNLPMMAFIIVGGLLILRKVQRFDMALTFFGFALLSDILTHASSEPLTTIQKALLHTPLLFFASIMITEPLTTPPTRGWRIAYGALVGALFSPFIHIGAVYSSPELALVVGNIFSYAISPKGKRTLTLKEKKKVSDDIYDFVFETDKKINFRPGQYLEWTLGHAKPDDRGNRRYFTIASSPTEGTVHLGIKFYEPSSTFKKKLLTLEPGDTIMAGQLAGDFTLPRDPAQKLAFIAGGIGITPFRSMVKDLTDRNEKRDAVLLYSNRNAAEIAYREVFDNAAEKMNMQTVYINSETEGRITAEMIKKEIPDYKERMFYISGTHSMTNAFEKTLSEMGVPRMHIKIDFFPGFA